MLVRQAAIRKYRGCRGAEDAGADVIGQGRDHSQENDADIGQGVGQDVLGRIDQGKQQGGKQETGHGQGRPEQQGHGRGRMNGPGYVVFLPGAVKLADDDGRAGGHADEKTDQEVDQRGGRPADRGQGHLVDPVSDDGGVCGIIKLLEEGAHDDGEKEKQKLFPDHAFCHRCDSFTPGKLPSAHVPILRPADSCAFLHYLIVFGEMQSGGQKKPRGGLLQCRPKFVTELYSFFGLWRPAR